MAVPSSGKCVVLFILVHVVYTGYSFKIRDAVPSTGSVDQSRLGACSPGVSGKCTSDHHQVDTRSSSLPPARRKYESDVGHGRIASKIRKPPVEAEESEESVLNDDGDDGHVAKNRLLSTARISRWSRDESETKKFKFVKTVVEAESEELDGADHDENDDNEDIEEIDADSDDDGVEISTADSDESNETAIIDADEDDDDAEENETEEDAEDDEDVPDQSDEISKNDSDDDVSEDVEDDEEESSTPVKKSVVEEAVYPLKGSSKSLKTRTPIDDKVSAEDENSEEETKVDRGKKPASKNAGDDTPSENTREQSASKPVGEIPTQEKKQSVKKIVKAREISEEEADDDDESSPLAAASPKPRKLEKVRLADKEKTKSMEITKVSKITIAPPNVKPKVAEEIVKPKIAEEIVKKIDETKKTKTKDAEGVPKAMQSEARPTTSPAKSETIAKPTIPEKSVKELATKKSVTNEESPKSGTTKNTENLKTDVEKSAKLPVAKKREDKSAKQKSEAPAETKTGGKKKEESSSVNKIDRTKSRPKKPAEASMSLTELNDAILRVPTFVPNFTAVEDPVCQQHGKIFLRQLRGYKLWALQMLDANAKIPSGLLRGNINQLGDFDQCLGITARVKVDEKTVKVQGKYCLATLDLHASIPDMKVPVHFMQSRGFIRGSIRDPGHFIPRFTSANWAMCIPAACSAEDAKSAIESGLTHWNVSSGVRFTVDVGPEMCYVRQKGQSYSKETIGVLYFFAMIICVVFVSTIRDYVADPQEKGNYSERIIMSFSLRRTWKILTKEGRMDSGEISCIHGIRSLATLALYVAHKMIPTTQMPYANRITLTEVANNPMSSVLRASLVYTDCFLLLSGLLTAFNMARETTKRGEIRWFCRFVARFIRLTPALLVMVFWYAYVMEHTGSGPQWNSVVVANAELCKQNSWTNLLYIQNFFPFEEMCATHTHQLALDMQLSLLAPIFVFFLTFKPIIGILLVFFLLQLSATLRYFATTSNYLSLVIFHGMTMKQLYKTANLTYALPLHRATPYIFGVGLGVLLHWTGKKVRIYKIFVLLGWLVAAALGLWSLFSPWRMARRDYTYDVEEAAHYAVIAPVSWSLALCWIIFACFTDHGGFVNNFLSSYWMTLFSRISYAVYLCQFAIFFYNVGTTRYTTEFQTHRVIDPYEATVVTLVSVILTLFIDIPMQEVKNVIMESTDVQSVPGSEPTSEPRQATSNNESAILPAEGTHPEKGVEEEEQEQESNSPHWHHQDDAIDGLTRIQDSADEEQSPDRWRRHSRSSVRRRSYVRREPYEDEEDEEDAEEGEYDSERAEWDWVKRPGSRMSVEDDGLLEHSRRSRSSQRPSYIEPDTGIREPSTYHYQRDDDYSRERRSLSRQPDRPLRRDESPRGSLQRERSAGRAPRRRDRQDEIGDEFPSRPESRGSFSGRDYEQIPTPSWESRRERSSSRVSESRVQPADRDDLQSGSQYSRSDSRGSFSGRDQPSTFSSWDGGRQERSSRRSSTPRRQEPVRVFSSGSEDDPAQQPHRPQPNPPQIIKKSPLEQKVSDEEDWEQELRIRRMKFMERLASEDREPKLQPDEGIDGWESVKRRSSAEGKLALLKDPTGSNVMDSWTVSRGPRVSLLGSSQETEDDLSYSSPHKDYRDSRQEMPLKEDDKSDEDSGADLSRRRSYTSGSQVTSLEEEEDDVANNDFVLKRGSKRITVMDLSKLAQQEGQESEEEPAGWKVVKEEEAVEDGQPKMATLKLFKRESIVKSQASEEDPEYLLPERPKLIEQEQDHPFKKAWQLQKSRSEEDGPSAYVLRDVKGQPEAAKIRKPEEVVKEDDEFIKDSEEPSSGGGQSMSDISHIDDPSDTTTIWLSRSFEAEDSRSRSSSKSENETDASKLEWPSEDEQFNRYKLRRRRESEEANYGWELEET